MAKKLALILGIALTLLIFLFATCTFNGPAAIPTLSPQQILQFGLTDYPSGWHLVSTTREYDWNAVAAYSFSFTSDEPYLSSALDFMQYKDESEAQNAFNQYEPTVFWSPGPVSISEWNTPTDLNPSPVHADQYRTACILQVLRTGVIEICAYWAQYGACTVKFDSHIGNRLMSYKDFQTMIEDTIDGRMSNIDYCSASDNSTASSRP